MAYLKDAYKIIYKHPSWEKTAKDWEDEFSTRLYKADFVQEAAHTALVRFSKLFQTYYGIRENARRLQQNPELRQNQQAMVDLAQKVGGTKVQYDKVIEDALLADRDQSTGAGQIGNARLNVQNPDAEEQKKATDTNKKNIEDVINQDGNLREQMTMLYNASFANGGMTPLQIRYSHSFKNMMANMTPADVMKIRQIGLMSGNQDLAAFDPKLDIVKEQANYEEGGDIMDSVPQVYHFKASLEKHARKPEKRKNAVSRTAGGIGRMVYMLNNKRQNRAVPLEGLGEEHYEVRNLPLSQREREYGMDKETDKLKWKEGFTYYQMEEPVTAKGLLQIAGASGTARRMLAAYKMLGATKTDLLYYRLALIAWMGTSRDHSLYEILKGSEQVGVKGTEDLSEAANMYMTVDPLTTEEIRKDFTKDTRFPHETVYLTILDEVKQARINAYNAFEANERRQGRRYHRPEDYAESPFSLADPNLEAHSTEDIALNVYTSDAYRNMNFNMRYGTLRKLGWKNYGLSDERDRYKAPTEEDPMYKPDGGHSYNGSLPHEAKNEALINQIGGAIRISARMALDSVNRRLNGKNADGEENGFSGTVYRGEKKSGRHTQGAEFETDTLTSTSKDSEVAHKFMKHGHDYPEAGQLFSDTIIGKYQLHGSGLDIEDLSQSASEKEVLVPSGVRFRVRRGPYLAVVDGDELREMNREERLLVRRLGERGNPLNQEKLAYAADLEEVVPSSRSRMKEEVRKKQQKRVMGRTQLLARKEMRDMDRRQEAAQLAREAALGGRKEDANKAAEENKAGVNEIINENQASGQVNAPVGNPPEKAEPKPEQKKAAAFNSVLKISEVNELTAHMQELLSEDNRLNFFGFVKGPARKMIGFAEGSGLKMDRANFARLVVAAACTSKDSAEMLQLICRLDCKSRADVPAVTGELKSLLNRLNKNLQADGIKALAERLKAGEAFGRPDAGPAKEDEKQEAKQAEGQANDQAGAKGKEPLEKQEAKQPEKAEPKPEEKKEAAAPNSVLKTAEVNELVTHMQELLSEENPLNVFGFVKGPAKKMISYAEGSGLEMDRANLARLLVIAACTLKETADMLQAVSKLECKSRVDVPAVSGEIKSLITRVNKKLQAEGIKALAGRIKAGEVFGLQEAGLAKEDEKQEDEKQAGNQAGGQAEGRQIRKEDEKQEEKQEVIKKPEETIAVQLAVPVKDALEFNAKLERWMDLANPLSVYLQISTAMNELFRFGADGVAGFELSPRILSRYLTLIVSRRAESFMLFKNVLDRPIKNQATLAKVIVSVFGELLKKETAYYENDWVEKRMLSEVAENAVEWREASDKEARRLAEQEQAKVRAKQAEGMPEKDPDESFEQGQQDLNKSFGGLDDSGDHLIPQGNVININDNVNNNNGGLLAQFEIIDHPKADPDQDLIVETGRKKGGRSNHAAAPRQAAPEAAVPQAVQPVKYWNQEAKVITAEMCRFFATNRGLQVYNKFEKKLRDWMKSAAGKTASKVEARLTARFLVCTALQDPATKLILQGLLKEPCENSKQVKELSKNYELLMEMIRKKQDRTTQQAIAFALKLHVPKDNKKK